MTTRVDQPEPSVQSAGRVKAMQLEEIYLQKRWNWPSIRRYCYHVVTSEVTISEGGQIKE